MKQVITETDRNKNENLAVGVYRLAQTFGLVDIYVFGSRAQEIATAVRKGVVLKLTQSPDVDIGVRPIQGVKLSPRNIVNLTIELEDLFDVNRVDLVVLPGCDPFLALNIIRGELLYTRDTVDQSRYELFVLRRAGDLHPFKKARIEMILQWQPQ
ncbi:MAG: nucleotidyltransferase domain-containing protein [Proteobacteria bacterium]|nr:nucleotidyltransferase domain-containing protein [Pseudomonadota bacterium]